MKICVAQIKPFAGDVQKNIDTHKRMIHTAISNNADMIVFPELSLTGYELALAPELATDQNDKRLDVFQELADLHKLVIAVGMPTKTGIDLFISMIIFQPGKERITYSKQNLYPGEDVVFKPGAGHVFLKFDDRHIVTPAICYDLSDAQHSKTAHENSANIYIASVVNSVNGVIGDSENLSNIAETYQMTVLMSNFIGQSGAYACAGNSSVWNKEGKIVGQLDDKSEGVLIYNTETEKLNEEL